MKKDVVPLKCGMPHPKKKSNDKKQPSLGVFLDKCPSPSASVARRAGEAAHLYSQDFEMHSKLANRARQRKRCQHVAQLRWSDLEIGKLLGRGTFSQVYEVQLLRRRIEAVDEEQVVTDDHTISTDVWDMASRWSEAEKPVREKVSDIWDLVSHSGTLADMPNEQDDAGCYALKHLHPATMKNERDFKASAIDLVLEAKLLSNLDHENIIKIHAVTAGSISTVFHGGGYFLLLDLLKETLEERIKKWRKQERSRSRARSLSRPRSRARSRPRSELGRVSSPESKQENGSEERLRSVALGVARGMEYLHSNRIIFRDLKPGNLGFDATGTIKIFDFGLAREIINPEQRLTGNTGSLRYMAPEVARHEHYGLKADVYSFGLLLWQICTLKLPYDGLNRIQHSETVVYGNERPRIEYVDGSEDLQILIEGCWDPAPDARPNFSGVRHSLLTQLAASRKVEQEEWAADLKDTAVRTSAARFRTRMRRRLGDDTAYGYKRFEEGETKQTGW